MYRCYTRYVCMNEKKMFPPSACKFVSKLALCEYKPHIKSLNAINKVYLLIYIYI